jgi:RNA polymerase sigma-70 factor (ECF subfamily)
MPDGDAKSGQDGARFSTTHWSVVLAAGDSQSPDAREALATLCRTYWYPVYAQFRHLENDADAARDLTQGFFTHLLEKRTIGVVTPDRGRFRSFLKTSLRNYRSHERDRDRAQKRGGGVPLVSLDGGVADSRYTQEPADTRSPDKIFEKRWARELLTRALDLLRHERYESDASERFDRLEPFLTGRGDGAGYRQVAGELGTSESAVKVAVHRMRRRFGALLRQEVARTVNDPDDVDEEIRYLFSVVDS